MRTNLERLEPFGIHPEKIYATGGGATSKVWMQIKADILNRPISSLCAKEVGACGTCMLVGVGIGLYRDLDEAKKVFVKEKQTCLPGECRAEVYDRYFKAYLSMYSAVRPIIEEAKA
jgi:xylulokinase